MDNFWHAKLKSNMIYLYKLENIINGNCSHLHIIREYYFNTWPKLEQMTFKVELKKIF